MHDLTGLGLSAEASSAYRALLDGRPAPAADDPLSSELEAAGLVHTGVRMARSCPTAPAAPRTGGRASRSR